MGVCCVAVVRGAGCFSGEWRAFVILLADFSPPKMIEWLHLRRGCMLCSIVWAADRVGQMNEMCFLPVMCCLQPIFGKHTSPRSEEPQSASLLFQIKCSLVVIVLRYGTDELEKIFFGVYYRCIGHHLFFFRLMFFSPSIICSVQ